MGDRVPSRIRLHQQSATLEIEYPEGRSWVLPAELLRVYSPSAEVQGHGQGPMQLVTGKQQVRIERVDPVGNYAVQLRFSDGHDSGIFSWDYLWDMGQNQASLWQRYLDRLQHAGGSREPAT